MQQIKSTYNGRPAELEWSLKCNVYFFIRQLVPVHNFVFREC